MKAPPHHPPNVRAKDVGATEIVTVVPGLRRSIRHLLNYSLEPIGYLFENLTEREKEIIGSQAELDEIRKLAGIDG